jgi:trehalose utilization protein
MGWYEGGEVFRSGVTYTRGCGKVFYFQPGHETFPVYYQSEIRAIIKNAAVWAAPDFRRASLGCPNIKNSPEGIENK